MEYVRLGKTGLKVSRLCLGCMTYGSSKWRDWVMDEAAARPFYRQALDLGINFFDTADMYSVGASEEVTGRMLKEMTRRDQVVIATKVYNPMGKGPNERGLSRKHIMEAVDASLKRLGTDYIGASSMHAWQFMKMVGLQRAGGLAQFVSMQPHYNLLYREEEREMLPLCATEGIGVIPWSPLARGFLAGNRKASDNPKQQAAAKGNAETSRAGTDEFAHMLYYREQDFEIVDRLTATAQRLGKPNAQVALAWMLSKPAITAPIVGATKPHHLEDAVATLSLKLTPEDIKSLEEPYKPKRVMGHT